MNADEILIDQHAHFQKQSYRNRTSILGANGKLDLIVPVAKIDHKAAIKDVKISYAEAWQKNHWRAICSAYKNSPYFEYFESEIEKFYTLKFESLVEYNTEQLKCIFKLLRMQKIIRFTSEFIKYAEDPQDHRLQIHPKKNAPENSSEAIFLSKKYYQTFSGKFDFVPNLSILDLLFNCGLKSLDHFPKDIFTE